MEGYFKGISYCFQFGVYWVMLDKRRPAVIISNDYYNTTTSTVMVVPTTSQDKSFVEGDDVPEYLRMYIPILSADESHKLTYIDMSQIRIVPKKCFGSKNFIGMITDMRVRELILERINERFTPNHPRMNVLTHEYQLEHHPNLLDTKDNCQHEDAVIDCDGIVEECENSDPVENDTTVNPSDVIDMMHQSLDTRLDSIETPRQKELFNTTLTQMGIKIVDNVKDDDSGKNNDNSCENDISKKIEAMPESRYRYPLLQIGQSCRVLHNNTDMVDVVSTNCVMTSSKMTDIPSEILQKYMTYGLTFNGPQIMQLYNCTQYKSTVTIHKVIDELASRREISERTKDVLNKYIKNRRNYKSLNDFILGKTKPTPQDPSNSAYKVSKSCKHKKTKKHGHK